MRMVLAILLITGAGALVCSGASVAFDLDRVPEEFRYKVERNLEAAGENRIQLETALLLVPSDRMPGMAFLVGNMPFTDLSSVTADFLLENVELAYRAREEFPWASGVPDDIFFNYVLNYRNSQEPAERWRAEFMADLKEYLGDTTDPTEAAIAVNRWCGERVKYKPTARRDQGPLETLRSGYGRCEEMVIFAAAAYRTVGIPYRQVWTPWWMTGDDNHAWAEILVDGKWWYIGACEPRDSLGDAWFNEGAQRAGMVLTGALDANFQKEKQVRVSSYFSPIDITSRYTETGRLIVTVTDDGQPVEGVSVSVNVFNYGALRSLAAKVTDENGKAAFTLGDGSFYVLAGGPQSRASAIVVLTPKSSEELNLKLGEPLSDGGHWLKYGEEVTTIEDTAG